MKKNISINISGIIFHIEEDGYEKLKNYLESINRYFSAFEDSHEIIADIETRIAEIFLAKLKDGSQVITLEDVEALIATMGSIKDFQAAEEEQYIDDKEDSNTYAEPSEREPLFSKKLYRDNKRKMLAGVLSGIAYYFSIDPLWIRLLFVLLFFGISIFPSIAGFLFIVYIVMWIVTPSSDELTEQQKIKKMYRDPDTKVLGGVAGGIAAYFGIDVVIIRLIFFVLIFAAGTGLILYLIMWIIIPEAKTLTDKMEMQGQPVTLSNIETNIRKSLNVTDGDENIFVKILLFPFRLIASLFEFLSKALGPFMSFVVEALRVVLGVVLTIIGIGGVLSVLIAAGVLIGVIASGDINVMLPLPYEMIKNDISLLPGLALVLSLLIPCFMIAILGFAVLMKRKLLNSKAGLSILALWLISGLVLAFTIPPVINGFTKEGHHNDIKRFPLQNKTVVLRLKDMGEDKFDMVSLRLVSAKDSVIKLVQEKRATGPTRAKATENALSIMYNVQQEDSIFIFDSMIQFGKEARFRKQHVTTTLYLPEGQKFVMDENMRDLLGNFMYRQGYSNQNLPGNTWTFTGNDLVCLTCPDKSTADDQDDVFTDMDRNFDVSDFLEIECNSPVVLHIKKGKGFKLGAKGREKDLENFVIDKTDNILTLSLEKPLNPMHKSYKKIDVYIVMPELRALQLGTAAKAFVSSFDQTFMDIELSGAANAEIKCDVESMDVAVSGASKLKLAGHGSKLNVHLTGASQLNAFEYDAADTELYTSNASSANVHAYDQLFIKAKGASHVTYRGEGHVDIEKSQGSSVSKE